MENFSPGHMAQVICEVSTYVCDCADTFLRQWLPVCEKNSSCLSLNTILLLAKQRIDRRLAQIESRHFFRSETDIESYLFLTVIVGYI